MGYCFGVRRAMDLTFTRLERSQGPVYSHGPLIHNQQALDLLKSKGLLDWSAVDVSEVPKNSTVIIRAHGLPPDAEAELRAAGVDVVDATCPRVAAVQRLVAQEVERGADIIIWGSAGHPEVDGLMGYAAGRGHVVANPADIAALPDFPRALLVAQTTQEKEGWSAMAEAAQRRFPGAKMVNTICQATVDRQADARRLAQESEALVVVGGKNSGNTKRLFEIGLAAGAPTISVEGPDEIAHDFMDGRASVGLLAGASTPLWQIRSVHQRLDELGRRSDRSLGVFLHRFLRALVLSNIYIGLGAGCLGLALARAMGVSPPFLLFSLFFFFVQSMHLLNAFVERGSARNNDPDRSVFMSKYKKMLVPCGLFSFAMALVGAAEAGLAVFLLAAFLYLCRVAYALPVPLKCFERRQIRAVKDLPLAKPLAVSLGWATLLAFCLPLSSPPWLPWSLEGAKALAVVFICVFLNLLCRTLLTDFEDSLGDRLFGTKTSVTLLGFEKAKKFLMILIFLWGACLILCWAFIVPKAPLLWLLPPGPIFNAVILRRLSDSIGVGGYRFDLMIDGQFLLTGLSILTWSRF
jgi:4-hydroxy-3-methylbut-2-enyl diphosphate reductase